MAFGSEPGQRVNTMAVVATRKTRDGIGRCMGRFYSHILKCYTEYTLLVFTSFKTFTEDHYTRQRRTKSRKKSKEKKNKKTQEGKKTKQNKKKGRWKKVTIEGKGGKSERKRRMREEKNKLKG